MSEVDEISKAIMPCCVFWDVVDFPFPDGLVPDSIYKKMKSCLEKIGYGGGELKIKAYVDKEKFSDRLVGEYRDAGITIQGAESESARVHSLLVDIVLWAFENPASNWEPLNLMVISKNIKDGTDFLSALEALKYRYYNVLLALPHDLSSKELQTVSFDWLLGSLLDGGQKSSYQSPTLLHKQKRKKGGTLFEVLPPSHSHDFVPVFLDVDSFPSYDKKDNIDLSEILREVLSRKGVHSHTPSVWAYVDEGEDKIEKFRGYVWYPEWLAIAVPTGDKYAKVTRMLLDILFGAMNEIPKNLMLLSQASTDTKCSTVIEALEAKHFKFILPPSNGILPMKQLSTEYFESNCKFILNAKPPKRPTNSRLVILLDAEDWEDIKPEFLYDSMRETLERKGYRLAAISVYCGSSKSKNLMYDYGTTGFKVRPVSSSMEWMMLPLMLSDILLMSKKFLHAGSTFIVMSNPSKGKISDKVFDRIRQGLEDEGINVFFALPDVLWMTFGSPVWSAKSLYDKDKCCLC